MTPVRGTVSSQVSLPQKPYPETWVWVLAPSAAMAFIPHVPLCHQEVTLSLRVRGTAHRDSPLKAA